jgi:hypothetical protein
VSCSTGDFLLQTGSQTRAKKMRIAGEEVESGGCKINFFRAETSWPSGLSQHHSENEGQTRCKRKEQSRSAPKTEPNWRKSAADLGDAHRNRWLAPEISARQKEIRNRICVEEENWGRKFPPGDGDNEVKENRLPGKTRWETKKPQEDWILEQEHESAALHVSGRKTQVMKTRTANQARVHETAPSGNWD